MVKKFLRTLLMLWIFSVPTYAIDTWLGDETDALYSYKRLSESQRCILAVEVAERLRRDHEGWLHAQTSNEESALLMARGMFRLKIPSIALSLGMDCKTPHDLAQAITKARDMFAKSDQARAFPEMSANDLEITIAYCKLVYARSLIDDAGLPKIADAVGRALSGDPGSKAAPFIEPNAYSLLYWVKYHIEDQLRAKSWLVKYEPNCTIM